jgi:hypothetical protein
MAPASSPAISAIEPAATGPSRYVLNLFAVPLLALAGAWQIAVVLIVLERTGRGIRSLVRDAMLSHAASQTGLGWGFGLHQALDQLGAVLGPLIVSGILFAGNGYRTGFAWLLVPALMSMTVLLAARLLFPRPHDFELAPPLPIPEASRRYFGYTSPRSPVSRSAMPTSR